MAVSTVALQQEGFGFKSIIWQQIFSVEFAAAWVLSRYSGFSPQSKEHTISGVRLIRGVNGGLSFCFSPTTYYWPVHCVPCFLLYGS